MELEEHHLNQHGTDLGKIDHHRRPRPPGQRLLGTRMVKQPQSVSSRQGTNYKWEKMNRKLEDTTLTKDKVH